MKTTRSILTILLVLLFCKADAQSSVTPEIQNLYNQNYRHIVYLGMDFSKVVLVGDFSEALGVGGDPATKNAYLKAWNNLVTGESHKYNVRSMVGNGNISVEIKEVMEMNYATKVDDLSGYKEPNYSESTIQEHLQTYPHTEKQGLGVVLLIESFNKNTRTAFIDFVVLSMETKEIVLLKKLQTAPRGRGLRNYWAGAIYEAFKKVERDLRGEWKEEVGL